MKQIQKEQILQFLNCLRHPKILLELYLSQQDSTDGLIARVLFCSKSNINEMVDLVSENQRINTCNDFDIAIVPNIGAGGASACNKQGRHSTISLYKIKEHKITF